MRRMASFALLLTLAGCGYPSAMSLPFSTGSNPYAPKGNSETMRRVRGEPISVTPLQSQAGDVWPGPLPPTPTLEDLEKQSNLPPLPEQAVPGSPLGRGAVPPLNQQPSLPPGRMRGSSTPPGSVQPGLARPSMVPPASPPGAAAASPPAKNPAGQAVQTPSGTGVITGGSQGYQTMTLPNGSSAIVIPNGNGTSSVIRSDGTIETIPTPR